LNEDQIKVRFDHEKQLADPFIAFRGALIEAALQQATLSKEFAAAGSRFNALLASASSIPLEPGTVDRIITSPPYINAVDYTMAHKYNMFVLGLLEPEGFKDHCREYIGVTERAVRVADMTSMPDARNATASQVVRKLQDQDTATAKNRAYVVAQYFSGMFAAFQSAYRVLRDDGLYVFVVGETNRICGIQVPTAQILREQAESAGFTVEVDVYHELANRSSMRLSRSASGGTIGREQVYVFRK
jgi:tRNA G10  N-methylase Trm11